MMTLSLWQDLDSVFAFSYARQNIEYGAKSTEFMAPPDYGFRLLRDATLRLARVDASVSELINPRQSSPITYAGSQLNQPDGAPSAGSAAAPGRPAPEALLERDGKPVHLTSLFGRGFVALVNGAASGLDALQALQDETRGAASCFQVVILGQGGHADPHGQARKHYGAQPGTVYLIRPDGYVMGRWAGADAAACALRAVAPFYA